MKNAVFDGFNYDGAEIIDTPIRGSISVTFLRESGEQIIHFFTRSPSVIRALYRQCVEMDNIILHKMN